MATTKRVVAEKIPATPTPMEAPTEAPIKTQIAIYNTVGDIESALSKSEKLKTINTTIAKYVNDITTAKITSDVTAKAVDNTVLEAKRYAKALTEEGEKARLPYNVTAKTIKAFYDALTIKLDVAVNAGKQAVLGYQETQKKVEAANQLKIQAQTEKLIKWVQESTANITATYTLADLKVSGKTAFDEFDNLDVSLLVEEVHKTALASIKDLGAKRFAGIKDGSIKLPTDDDIDDPDGGNSTHEEQTEIASVSASQNIIESMKQAQDHAIVVAMPVTKFSTVATKIVAFKPFKGEDAVDKKFMSVDSAKVKVFLSENRDNIKKQLDSPGVTEGYVAGGLLFYYEKGSRTS